MTSEKPARGDLLRIEKRDARGRPVIAYPGWLISDADPILILARWDAPDLPLPYTTFARSDLLLEAYFRQRPYNIFALFDGRNAPVGADWGGILRQFGGDFSGLASLQPLCRSFSVDCPLKGFYINFTRPVVFDPADRRLVWQDMVLDLWIPAAGEARVLDEDDYRALNLAQSDPDLAQSIDQARQDLLAQARTRTGFFASSD